MTGGGWAYGAIFAASVFLGLVLTPLALRTAVRFGVFDHPEGHKNHGSPVPYLGGLALVLSFSVAVLGAATVKPPVTGLDELFGAVGIAVALSVVGLFDDIKGLGPWIRLAVEILAAVGLVAAGVTAELFPVAPANAALTIVWVVGITNAFNLLDNMDGLSAGVAAIAASSFFVIAALNDQFLVAGLSAALAGCAVGFLRHNFYPARIYMGDAGSLFLGFLLAYLGLKLRFEGSASVTFLVPVLVLGVAVLDTTLVTAARLRERRSPFQGGLDHVSHRLVFIGVPVRAAVGLIYGAAVGLGITALVVSRVDRVSAYLLAGLVLVGGLFIAMLLNRVPVYRGHEAWTEVDAARAAELVESIHYEEAAGRPMRNRQARLGSLFGSAERS